MLKISCFCKCSSSCQYVSPPWTCEGVKAEFQTNDRCGGGIGGAIQIMSLVPFPATTDPKNSQSMY